MPRIHTGAVIWYSGTPISLAGELLRLANAAFADTKMHECRKSATGTPGWR